jgi:hypothetical protein
VGLDYKLVEWYLKVLINKIPWISNVCTFNNCIALLVEKELVCIIVTVLIVGLNNKLLIKVAVDDGKLKNY